MIFYSKFSFFFNFSYPNLQFSFQIFQKYITINNNRHLRIWVKSNKMYFSNCLVIQIYMYCTTQNRKEEIRCTRFFWRYQTTNSLYYTLNGSALYVKQSNIWNLKWVTLRFWSRYHYLYQVFRYVSICLKGPRMSDPEVFSI